MFTRLLQLPKNQSLFLFGPRNTGKSTLIRHTYPDAFLIDLLDFICFQEISLEGQLLRLCDISPSMSIIDIKHFNYPEGLFSSSVRLIIDV